MKKTIIFANAILAGLALFCGCQTVPTEISEDLDARQLIQLGQDNYDNHHYNAAEIYFNTVLERYGDDPKHYLEAKYELGHLYLKLKKYSAAYDNFKEIEEIYENVPVGLPGSYRILCGIELAKIPEEKIKEFEARAKIVQETPEERAAREAERKEAAQKAYEDAVTKQIEREKEMAKKRSEAEEAAPASETKEIEPPKEEGPSEASESANE